MSLSDELSKRQITLPQVSGPFGAYVPAKRVGNLIYIAGQLPMKDGRLIAKGRVPTVCGIDVACAGARQCVINALAAAQSVVKSIDEITGVARVGVFVSSDETFTEQPKVANGASEFLVELFGNTGQHVRAAVGASSLPLDAAVEVEFIFEVRV